MLDAYLLCCICCARRRGSANALRWQSNKHTKGKLIREERIYLWFHKTYLRPWTRDHSISIPLESCYMLHTSCPRKTPDTITKIPMNQNSPSLNPMDAFGLIGIQEVNPTACFGAKMGNHMRWFFFFFLDFNFIFWFIDFAARNCFWVSGLVMIWGGIYAESLNRLQNE